MLIMLKSNHFNYLQKQLILEINTNTTFELNQRL